MVVRAFISDIQAMEDENYDYGSHGFFPRNYLPTYSASSPQSNTPPHGRTEMDITPNRRYPLLPTNHSMYTNSYVHHPPNQHPQQDLNSSVSSLLESQKQILEKLEDVSKRLRKLEEKSTATESQRLPPELSVSTCYMSLGNSVRIL